MTSAIRRWINYPRCWMGHLWTHCEIVERRKRDGTLISITAADLCSRCGATKHIPNAAENYFAGAPKLGPPSECQIGVFVRWPIK